MFIFLIAAAVLTGWTAAAILVLAVFAGGRRNWAAEQAATARAGRKAADR